MQIWVMHRWLSSLTLVVLTATACRSADPDEQPTLVVIDHEGSSAQLLEVKPRAALARVTKTSRQLVLELVPDRLSETLSLRLPGACPIQLKRTQIKPGKASRVRATPYLELGPNRSEIGFDERFEITASPGCAQAEQGRVTWKQIEGPPLANKKTERRGLVFSAQTAKHQDLLPNPPRGRIVAVSPRNSGRAVVEATLTLPDGSAHSYRVSVAAVSRARGLPNVPVDASVLLGGEGWSWLQRPPGASAQITENGGLSWFRPRVSGRWILADPDGNRLALQSASYAALPLDCTRSGCHENEQLGRAGRMGSVMSRGLADHLGPFYDPGCAIACHAVGEPGIDDGGFDHVARQLDFRLDAHTPPSALPPALQRLSNVGCLGCHGPGTIPEPSARWSILSADVCGYCHDQPPRYDHVASWKRNGMSRADRDASAREDAACVGCHTSWGFLSSEHPEHSTRRPPAGVSLGISCAACHDVHQNPSSDALVRRRALPAAASDLSTDALGSSAVCIACHAPVRSGSFAELPSASVTAIFAGRYGFDDRGQELRARGSHEDVGGGCLACHGENHAFAAPLTRCSACHEPKPRDGSLQKHARALWSRLAERGAVEPFTSRTHIELRFSKPNHAEKLAAYNVALVLLDSAADVHNPDYATLLLEVASGMLRIPKRGAE